MFLLLAPKPAETTDEPVVTERYDLFIYSFIDVRKCETTNCGFLRLEILKFFNTAFLSTCFILLLLFSFIRSLVVR